MKRNTKSFFAISFLVCALGVGIAASTRTEGEAITKAETVTNMTMKDLLTGAWNNDGVYSSDLLDCFIGHGTLSTSGSPGYAPMTKSNTNPGDFNGTEGKGFIDWAGNEFNSQSDDRIMLKFQAIKPVKIDIGATAAPAGWMDASDTVQLNYYKLDNDVVNGRWYTADKSISMVTGTTTAEDIAYSVTLDVGQFFIFEYGRQFDGSRTWQHVGETVNFSFTRDEIPCHNQLYFADIVTNFTQAGEEVLTHGPLSSYGVYHGNVESGTVTEFDTIENQHLASSNVQCWNYGATFKSNDSLVFAFEADEHLIFHVSREFAGTEWLAGAYLKYWRNSDLLMSKTFSSFEEPAPSEFEFYGTLDEGDVFYFEIGFQWSDNIRKINMLNDGDIHTSLPRFDFIGTEYNEDLETAKTFGTTLYNSIKCYHGAQIPTIEGTTWDSLKAAFEALNPSVKALLRGGHYTVSNEEAVPLGDTPLEIAKGLARYDQLVAIYSFEDFIDRHPTTELFGINQINLPSNNNVLFLVVGIVGVSALCAVLIFNKKKHSK